MAPHDRSPATVSGDRASQFHPRGNGYIEDSLKSSRPQDGPAGRYPEGVGFKGSANGPGADGAAYYERQVKGRRRQVLDGLQGLGGRGTAEQIGARVGLHWYLTRPRLSELKALGLVIETGERGTSALGGQSTLWRVTTNDERSLHAARRSAEAEKTGEADHG